MYKICRETFLLTCQIIFFCGCNFLSSPLEVVNDPSLNFSNLSTELTTISDATSCEKKISFENDHFTVKKYSGEIVFDSKNNDPSFGIDYNFEEVIKNEDFLVYLFTVKSTSLNKFLTFFLSVPVVSSESKVVRKSCILSDLNIHNP